VCLRVGAVGTTSSGASPAAAARVRTEGAQPVSRQQLALKGIPIGPAATLALTALTHYEFPVGYPVPPALATAAHPGRLIYTDIACPIPKKNNLAYVTRYISPCVL
jgi:hypothetical protein